jgi:Peroxiredoxin
MISLLLDNIWLILFVALGLPLLTYRSKFRKIVYQTSSWAINIKPVFADELRGIIGDHCIDHPRYKRIRSFYRSYLVTYLVLILFYFDFSGFTQTKPSDASQTRIGVGSKVPSFSLKDQYGNTFSIDSVIGKQNLLIYFYPKDNSPGCTREACAFRDEFEVFRKAGTMIIGISGQSVESHKNFADANRVNFTLLSDEGNKVRKLFGVPSNLMGAMPGRVTYIIDKKGKVVFVYGSQIRAQNHPKKALEFLKNFK